VKVTRVRQGASLKAI